MEQQLVITGEVVGVLLLIVVLLVASQLVRRNRIARGGPMVLMALRSHAGWRTGMARVGVDDIAWFTLFGFDTRPVRVWERHELDVGAPEPTERRPSAMSNPVLVPFVVSGRTVEVVVSRGDYTALRSWSESAPPGRNANVT